MMCIILFWTFADCSLSPADHRLGMMSPVVPDMFRLLYRYAQGCFFAAIGKGNDGLAFARFISHIGTSSSYG